MATNPDFKTDLTALRNLISEAHLNLSTIKLAQGRATRVSELLASAIALTDHLMEESPAAQLGQRGGMKTAERGPEYFKKIAAMRKTRAGGRPPKPINNGG